MPIDTGKVNQRRAVSYASLREVLADAERLSQGKIKALGNWSPGQVFEHLARTMNQSIDGANFKIHWLVRMILPLMKSRMLKGPMRPGFKLPAGAARELVPGPTSTADGLAALRAATQRQERESKRAPSPAFGALTRDEWDRLHLIHAALHMSFLMPAE
jgi:hypothetical protein